MGFIDGLLSKIDETFHITEKHKKGESVAQIAEEVVLGVAASAMKAISPEIGAAAKHAVSASSIPPLAHASQGAPATTPSAQGHSGSRSFP